jgi:hypothetical protein
MGQVTKRVLGFDSVQFFCVAFDYVSNGCTTLVDQNLNVHF